MLLTIQDIIIIIITTGFDYNLAIIRPKYQNWGAVNAVILMGLSSNRWKRGENIITLYDFLS